MRSESTSALGQPSETKPTLGAAAERVERALSGAIFIAAFILGSGVRGRSTRVVVALRLHKRIGSGGKVGKWKVAEQIASLFLHLLLHFEEGAGALLEIAPHQSLDGGTLHLQKFAPGIGIESRRGGAAVYRTRLLLQLFLDLDERLDVLFQI